MSENEAPTTEPAAPALTDDAATTAPAATQPSSSAPGTATEEETVTLKKSDYTNLVSQRDRGNSEAAASNEFVAQLAKEREIDGFLADNKEKYPDITRADIMPLVDDPDMLEATADRLQATITNAVQNKLMNVQRATAPELSPEERTERLKTLKKNPGSASFAEMVEIQGGV